MQAGKEAAARRERELGEELRDAGDEHVSDEITLVIPAQEDFRQIAHLVLGGLGVRADLTYEDLDDLQTALDALLGCRDDAGDMHVRFDVQATTRCARPSARSPSRSSTSSRASRRDFGLRRVLETVDRRLRGRAARRRRLGRVHEAHERAAEAAG